MKKAVIIGASSGIGWALAFSLSKEGYAVGMTGRRVELLEELWKALPGPGYVQPMDLTRPDDARAAFHYLVEEMGGVDLVVINAGVGYLQDGLAWDHEKLTLAVNVTGFVAIATAALALFQEQEGRQAGQREQSGRDQQGDWHELRGGLAGGLGMTDPGQAGTQ